MGGGLYTGTVLGRIVDRSLFLYHDESRTRHQSVCGTYSSSNILHTPTHYTKHDNGCRVTILLFGFGSQNSPGIPSGPHTLSDFNLSITENNVFFVSVSSVIYLPMSSDSDRLAPVLVVLFEFTRNKQNCIRGLTKHVDWFNTRSSSLFLEEGSSDRCKLSPSMTYPVYNNISFQCQCHHTGVMIPFCKSLPPATIYSCRHWFCVCGHSSVATLSWIPFRLSPRAH